MKGNTVVQGFSCCCECAREGSGFAGGRYSDALFSRDVYLPAPSLPLPSPEPCSTAFPRTYRIAAGQVMERQQHACNGAKVVL